MGGRRDLKKVIMKEAKLDRSVEERGRISKLH